jgi:hypothetical protein
MDQVRFDFGLQARLPAGLPVVRVKRDPLPAQRAGLEETRRTNPRR